MFSTSMKKPNSSFEQNHVIIEEQEITTPFQDQSGDNSQVLATTKSEREAIDAFMDESNYKTSSP